MTGVGKMTAVVAVIFMLTSLSLAYLSSQAARESVVREIEAVPTLPGTSTTQPAETEAIQIPVEETSDELEQKAAPPIDSENPPTNSSTRFLRSHETPDAPQACQIILGPSRTF